MAGENNEELSLEDEETTTKSGGKKKLIIIIVAAVLLLGGGAGVYFFFFSGDDSTEALGQSEAQENNSEEPIEVETASYVPMPRPFVFNVMDGKRDRLVQIKVQLLIRGNDKVSLAKKHIPLLEDTLVRVFSAASVEQLRSPEGKQELRAFSLKAINEVTTKYENKALVDSVLFTGFVLQ
jgi:flagellar FliL protein